MALENSHLYREIHEQPLSLRALLRDERAAIERLAAAIAARSSRSSARSDDGCSWISR